MTNLSRHERKDKHLSYAFEWTIYFAVQLFLAPRYVWTKPVLIESGLTKDKWPILHSVLFEWRL